MRVLGLLSMMLVTSIPALGAEITAIIPSSGPTAGGTVVTIHGAGFKDFECPFGPCFPGGLRVGGMLVGLELTDTTARFTTPPHPSGEVEVELALPSGQILLTTFFYTDTRQIPTLSEWGLLLMAVTLAVVALKRLV